MFDILLGDETEFVSVVRLRSNNCISAFNYETYLFLFGVRTTYVLCVDYIFLRCYPGPWKVLRRVRTGKYVCLHQQNSMPSLKEVALEILPSA